MRSNPCPLCAHANPVTARSCEACGVGMVATCQHCGAINDTEALRCLRCDATLPAGEGIAEGPGNEASSVVAAEADANSRTRAAFDSGTHSGPLLPVQMRVRFNRDRTLDLEWPDGQGGVVLHTIHPPDAGNTALDAPWIRLGPDTSARALVTEPQRPAQTAVAVFGSASSQQRTQQVAQQPASTVPAATRRWPVPLISIALAGGVIAAALAMWPRGSAVTSPGLDPATSTAAKPAAVEPAAVKPVAAAAEPARQTVEAATAPVARSAAIPQATALLPAKTGAATTAVLQDSAKAPAPLTGSLPVPVPAVAATAASAASPQQAIDGIDENPPSAGRRAQAARPARSAAVHKPAAPRTASARSVPTKVPTAPVYATPSAPPTTPPSTPPTSATAVAAVLGTQAQPKPAAQELPLRLSACSNSVAALGLCNVGPAANPVPRKD